MIEMLGQIQGVTRDDLLRNTLLREEADCICFEYVHIPSYADDTSPVPLAVLFLHDMMNETLLDGVLKGETGNTARCYCLISNEPAKMRAVVAAQNHNAATASGSTLFSEVVRLTGLVPLELTRPLRLSPVFIPKPWGREIWYTGIESRGMSGMQGVPIAWVLDIFGGLLGGLDDVGDDVTKDTSVAPILLKILDPHPVENLGDLYFEMHREKVEVYVVTSLDTVAWPKGVGQIRYGFNQALLQSYSPGGELSQARFLQDYLASVEAYRGVRCRIDELLDDIKLKEGRDPDDVISPATQAQWNTQLPANLIAEESRRRAAMYAYTTVRDITVGDVIHVRPCTPHALQHGVRVVEFQTPHYERFILSFGQKVLTQTGWDTREALPLVSTDSSWPADIKEVSPGIDLIADFGQFQVRRLNIAAGDSKTLICNGYALAMGILGEVDTGRAAGAKTAQENAALTRRIRPEEAVYIPAGSEQLQFTNTGPDPACILVAFPPGG